jgi:hypothetical protein
VNLFAMVANAKHIIAIESKANVFFMMIGMKYKLFK